MERLWNYWKYLWESRTNYWLDIHMNETTRAKIIWFTILCIITNFIVCTLLSLFLSDYIDPYTNKAIIYYIFTAITGIYVFYLLIF